MLGSTVAATDAAAVFAVLRGSTLRRRLARTLEGESGINDPIAILLVIGCIEAIQDPSFGLADALLLAVRELAIGFVVGLAVAGAAVLFLRRVRLPSAGLYPVASIATGALAFGARRRTARLGLPGGVPRRAGARHRVDARAAHDRHVPRRPGVGRPARAVPHRWACCVPGRLDDIALKGDGDRARDRRGGPPARRGGRDRVLRDSTCASGCCSAGPACAARRRSCSPRSR